MWFWLIASKFCGALQNKLVFPQAGNAPCLDHPKQTCLESRISWKVVPSKISLPRHTQPSLSRQSIHPLGIPCTLLRPCQKACSHLQPTPMFQQVPTTEKQVSVTAESPGQFEEPPPFQNLGAAESQISSHGEASAKTSDGPIVEGCQGKMVLCQFGVPPLSNKMILWTS